MWVGGCVCVSRVVQTCDFKASKVTFGQIIFTEWYYLLMPFSLTPRKQYIVSWFVVSITALKAKRSFGRLAKTTLKVLKIQFGIGTSGIKWSVSPVMWSSEVNPRRSQNHFEGDKKEQGNEPSPSNNSQTNAELTYRWNPKRVITEKIFQFRWWCLFSSRSRPAFWVEIEARATQSLQVSQCAILTTMASVKTQSTKRIFPKGLQNRLFL